MTAFGYEKGQLPANPAAFLSDQQLADLADEIAQSQGQNKTWFNLLREIALLIAKKKLLN